MANRLKMAEVELIQALLARGWSRRRIARELGMDRETVRRYARVAARPLSGSGLKAPLNPPLGSDVQNQPNPPPGSAVQNQPNPPPARLSSPKSGSSGPPSACQPFREIILAALEQGLSGQRIWQDLRSDHGFAGGYDCIKRFVRRLNASTPLPFRRMECAPGAEAQVDFGQGAPVITPEGQRRRTHVLRIVLSHSRKGYSEAVYRQTTEDFIRCLENAFHHFGGVPHTLVIDNLRAAVSKADWFDPELNPKLRAFCGHYQTVILPTKPAMPRHKGKVERAVDYVQENALKGKQVASLADENRHLLEWETQVADTRIHGTTRQQVKKCFEEVERSALSPLPAEGRFPFFHEGQRKVNRDGHVEVDKAYYSVPAEYLGHTVWARWDGRVVRIFNHRFEQIAYHARHEPGRFSSQPGHIPERKRSGIEKGTAWLLNKASLIGPQTARWSEQMLAQRGIEGVRVLLGLLSLSKQHPCDRIEQACELALSHGAYHLRTIRELIQRKGDRQEQFAFIEEHAIIRSLSEYGELAHAAFHKENTP
jgi:transposase